MCIRLHGGGVSIVSGVFLKVFDVENFISEVRRNQHIDVEIDVAQDVPVKAWRLIYVAVKTVQPVIRVAKAKDVVPAIEPVVLGANRSRWNCAEEIVFDLLVEYGIQDQERPVSFCDASGPATMFTTIVLEHAHHDFCCSYRLLPSTYFVPRFAQSARNCACPLSVNG